jgi:prepilin-type processing-associated H-X9-DG protein
MSLKFFCLDRHGSGRTNMTFMDGSSRPVGLKELWTLKWYRGCPPAGPWTRAGGVLPEDWPKWMRRFKDY